MRRRISSAATRASSGVRSFMHDAPEHGRRGGRRTGRDRLEQHQRRAPRARVAALQQVGQRGHDRRRLARRQRLGRLLGAAAQRRIRIAQRERDDAGGVPGRQRRRLLKHGRAHVRRAIAQRRAQRRRVGRASGRAGSVPRHRAPGGRLRFARLTARYGGRDRDAAAPDLGRHVGQRAREDLVLAGAAPADHGQRRQDLAARRRIAERELQRRDAVRIAEQRLRDPARDGPQAVQHLAQPAGHAPGRRRVQRPRDAPGGDARDVSRAEPARRVAGVGDDRAERRVVGQEVEERGPRPAEPDDDARRRPAVGGIERERVRAARIRVEAGDDQDRDARRPG